MSAAEPVSALGTEVTAVGFDADDTLWHCEPMFAATTAQLIDLLRPWTSEDPSFAGEAAQRHLEAVERHNLAAFGYGAKGYVLSMIETAIQLSDGKVTGDEIQRIIDWGRRIIAGPFEPFDGVDEVLTALGGRVRLLLITKGDLFEQEAKIASSGLADRFDGVEILSEKEPRTYLSVLERHGIDPEGFVMVGNSVRSDILPVLECGGWAVHIPAELDWAHEVAAVPDTHPRFRGLTHIRELPELLDLPEAAQSKVPYKRSPASPSPGTM